MNVDEYEFKERYNTQLVGTIFTVAVAFLLVAVVALLLSGHFPFSDTSSSLASVPAAQPAASSVPSAQAAPLAPAHP